MIYRTGPQEIKLRKGLTVVTGPKMGTYFENLLHEEVHSSRLLAVGFGLSEFLAWLGPNIRYKYMMNGVTTVVVKRSHNRLLAFYGNCRMVHITNEF